MTNKFDIKCKINKIDEDQRTVFAWASVIEENGQQIIDRQNDIIEEEELEIGAYNYVMNSRDGGEMHVKRGVATLIESMVFTKQKQEALGIDLGKIGWFVGFYIQDDNVWEKIKNGSYSMLSIGGYSSVEEVE